MGVRNRFRDLVGFVAIATAIGYFLLPWNTPTKNETDAAAFSKPSTKMPDASSHNPAVSQPVDSARTHESMTKIPGAVPSDAPVRASPKAVSSVAVSSWVSSYEILQVFPHDHDRFTQGLAFDTDGVMWESSGLYKHSQLRSVDIVSGKNLETFVYKPRLFGEGITHIPGTNRIVGLTWKEKVILDFQMHKGASISGRTTVSLIREVEDPVKTEGWGLAADPEGSLLYRTDGVKPILYVQDPHTFSIVREIDVVDPALGNQPIVGLNELEWINGELWANILPLYHGRASECIARIDAETGKVKGWIDLNGLLDQQEARVRRQRKGLVLNGIAWNARTDELYVTGKQWNHMYRIKTAPTDKGPEHVRQRCDLHLTDSKTKKKHK